MKTERLQNGQKLPEQIREDLKRNLIPIVGSPEAAEDWIEGISRLAVVIGGRATIIPSRAGEEVLRIVFRGEGDHNILATFEPLSKRNKER